MGGDEFAPLIPEIKVKEMVDEVAQRILVAMGTPFILHDIEERITVSFGIAIYQATRLVKDMFLEIAVLVLTESLNDSFVIDAIHAGAGGYIFLKDMTPEVLLQSIHHVIEGVTQMKTELLHTAVENLIQNGRKTLAERTTEAAHLTEREVDILRLMGNGDSNKVMAETLGITLDTVKKHVRNVIDKLQARSRTHAAIIAAQAGIVGNPITHLIQSKSDVS